MAEDIAAPKSKSKPASPVTPMFECRNLKCRSSKCRSSKSPTSTCRRWKCPAAFREIAEKSITQAKETYEKMKHAAEEATDMLEGTYATASKGCADYGLKVIETARTNSNAAFDLMSKLFGAKSYAEAVELSTGYMRSQFETMTAQAKELTEHAQKVATETAEPIKESFTSAFNKAA